MKRRKRRKFRVFRTIRRIILGLLAIFMVAGLSMYFILIRPEVEKIKEMAYEKLENTDESDILKLSDTRIYDDDGEFLGLVNAGHYEYVKIDEISPYLKDAYIAVEDRNFETHKGVDYKATLRAALSFVKNKGHIRQGGSTITQQLVKNAYLSREKTFSRKFAEMIIARELEKKYDKNHIMELYCNINFYGNNCYGVGAASRYYFGKSVTDLDIAEAAMIAGLSNAPSALDPIRHPKRCLKRRNKVLKSMCECGYISLSEYEEYSTKELGLQISKQAKTSEDYMSSYALYCAAITMMDIEGFKFEYLWDDKESYNEYMDRYQEEYEYYTKLIRQGGYSIYTSLRPKVQEAVQSNIDSHLKEFKTKSENGKYALQAASVVVDNESGYVVAIVGGRGKDDPFNRAFLSARQPGSCIKPLIVYGPAFDTGRYSPGTIVDDHKFDGGPSNAGSYFGNVTVREALNRSLNTVAWQIFENIGIKNGLSYLAKMHFRDLSYVDHGVKALSIGGFTKGLRVVDMAKGFSTLANMGLYNGKTCIKKIVSETDGEITKNYNIYNEKVYKKDSAWMLTDVLKGTMTSPYGTGRGLSLNNNMPCAGKTGTTNGSKDCWFCGYTRYYTMAVWMGYDTPKRMPGIYGRTYAGLIWRDSMNEIHKGLKALDWEKPDTVIFDGKPVLSEEDMLDPEKLEMYRNSAATDDYISSEYTEKKKQLELENTRKEAREKVYDAVLEYENTDINSVKDVFKERELYSTIRKYMDHLSEKEQNEIYVRIMPIKEHFDSIELSMSDEINEYERNNINDQEENIEPNISSPLEEVLIDSIKKLEDIKYQGKESEKLIKECLENLKYVSEDDNYIYYVERLERAIKHVKTLPFEKEYKDDNEFNINDRDRTDIENYGPSAHLDESKDYPNSQDENPGVYDSIDNEDEEGPGYKDGEIIKIPLDNDGPGESSVEEYGPGI